MCIYMCVYIYVCVYTYISTYIYVCVCVYTYINIRAVGIEKSESSRFALLFSRVRERKYSEKAFTANCATPDPKALRSGVQPSRPLGALRGDLTDSTDSTSPATLFKKKKKERKKEKKEIKILA